MNYFAHDALVGIIVFEAVTLLVAATNGWVMRRSRRARLADKPPMVSVLIPARNEEATVGGCVRSLLRQDYPSLEIVVLDDESTDDTRSVLEEAAREASREGPQLRVLHGEPLPEGWIGKAWACDQLAKAATGELLLFADADIVFESGGIGKLVACFAAEDADLLSGLPRQRLGTVGEKLIVPVLPWAVFLFAPLVLGLVSPRITPARAVGQLMLFRRDAYDAIGGHESVRAEVLDDIGLSKQVRLNRSVLRFADLRDVASCRMYRSGKGAVDGFRKNLFAVFDYRALPYVFAWAWLGFAYVEPFAILAAHAIAPSAVPLYAGLLGGAMGLALVQWLFTYAYFGLPMWPALVYPITMLAFDFVSMCSFVDAFWGTSVWRGRVVRHPPVRLL